MSKNLLYDLMKLPNPEALIREALTEIEKEKEQRKAFREWVRPDMKAEFINGEVISHSPALRRHNQAVKRIAYILETFADLNDAGEIAIEKAMVGLERSDLEPDVVFWKKETADNFKDDMLYYPAPDFVVEVLSNGTESRDRGEKFFAYEEAGVSEYWLVDCQRHLVEQYLLKKDVDDSLRFKLATTLQIAEVIKCHVLAGLIIPIRAFFDAKAKRRVVKSMLAEEE